jgi:hypothetical protein
MNVEELEEKPPAEMLHTMSMDTHSAHCYGGGGGAGGFGVGGGWARSGRGRGRGTEEPVAGPPRVHGRRGCKQQVPLQGGMLLPCWNGTAAPASPP